MRFDEAFLSGFTPSFRMGWQGAGDDMRQQRQLDEAMQRRTQADAQFQKEMELRSKAQQDAVTSRAETNARLDRELDERAKDRAAMREENQKYRDDTTAARREAEASTAKLRSAQEYNLHFDNAMRNIPGMAPEELLTMAKPIAAKVKAGQPLDAREQAYLDAGKFAYGMMRNPTIEQSENIYPAGPDGKPDMHMPAIGVRKSRVPTPGATPWPSFDEALSGKPIQVASPLAPEPAVDPVLGARFALVEDLMKQRSDAAKQTLGEDAKQIATGDNRFGFLNLNSRADRVKESEATIRQSVQDQQALQWAQKNPGDPKAAALLDDLTKRYAK